MNTLPHHCKFVYAPILALLLACPPGSFAAGSVTANGFVIDPALPVLGDPSLGYADVDPSATIQLTGGPALDDNDFFYPATRLGKFSFDVGAVGSLFPIAGNANGLVASSISVRMSIADLDTNPGNGIVEDDIDFEDLIFALSLNDADDGTTLARVLTDSDGGAAITPQFITGFGNEPLTTENPDTATNTYDLGVAPVLGATLADLFANSNGTVWLYIIDTDDAGNNISLANSLASDFALTVDFVDATVVPLPAAAWLFGGAILSLMSVRRQRRTS